MFGDTLDPAPSLGHQFGMVAEYRIFLLAQCGRILDMVPLQAASFTEARRRARGFVGEADVVELWTGLSVVARFERAVRTRPDA